MRKRWIAGSIAILALTMPVTVTASAVSRSKPKKSSLRVLLTLTSNNLVHNGKTSPITPSTKYAPGDNAYFTADISRGGHKIGREDGTCGFTTNLIEVCTSVDHLSGGTIVHVGANSIAKETFTDAITGDTGTFADATGSVTGTFSGANSIDQTYHLQ
jgi:hypothetical protein